MDRLDYLSRDSFYTGVTEGNIGSARIIKMLDVIDDHLVVEAKGIYSIENFLMARRLMYWQVYLHKTIIIQISRNHIVRIRISEMLLRTQTSMQQLLAALGTSSKRLSALHTVTTTTLSFGKIKMS